jgi:hypothetical protein
MVVHTCKGCGEEFKKKSTYISHLNRINPCDKSIDSILGKVISSEISGKKINSAMIKKYLEDNKCAYCEKIFTKKSSVIQHMRENCKEIKKIEKEKQTIFDKLKELEEVKEKNIRLEEEIKKLKENTKQKITTTTTTNTNSHNNTTNNTNNTNSHNTIANSNINSNINSNNNTQNIMMVGYGKEDMKKFLKEDIVKALKRVYGAPFLGARNKIMTDCDPS